MPCRSLVYSASGGSLPPSRIGLTEAGSDEPSDARGSEPEHLESVPDRQQPKQVQPAWRTLIDEGSEPDGGGEVKDGQQHRCWPPLHAASGPYDVSEDVGGHVAAQEVPDVDADHYQEADLT